MKALFLCFYRGDTMCENKMYTGKIDINKLGKYKERVITEEVILTEERIKHIKERHPRRL